MRIRKYQPDDALKTAELFRDTVKRINRRDYSSDQIDAWAPDNIDIDAWSSRLQKSHTYLAESEDGGLLGFITVDQEGCLDLLYCHADHQRQGVGSRLWSHAQRQAQSGGLSYWFTEASITARPFFEKHGFKILKVQEVQKCGVSFVNYRMGKRC